MDCRDTRPMLAAFHDGELQPAERARVAEHLRGCGDCSALLARLGGIDANVDVPDPGPEYWDRFNERVMERVERDRVVPIAAPRPKPGWARRQLPYLVPAVAAAALFVMVVRHAGLDPFKAAGPRVPEVIATPGEENARQVDAKAAPGSVLAKKPDGIPAAPRALADRNGQSPLRAAGREGEVAVVPRAVERPAPADAAPAAPHAADPPAGIDRYPAPSAPTPAAAPPSADYRGARGGPPGAFPEKKEAADGGRPALAAGENAPASRPSSAPASGAPGNAAAFAGIGGLRQERAATPGADEDRALSRADAAAEGEVSGGKPGGAAAKSKSAAVTPAAPSPCGTARDLAARGRLKEAESAQRACLAQDQAPAVQEKGLIFLAELLDRQSRFDEADAVIREAGRQFPGSRRLDDYIRQRPLVQDGRLPADR